MNKKNLLENIPFNKPFLTGGELENINQCNLNSHLSGDGEFTKLCSKALEDITGTKKALLTHSCTAALELAALLINIKPGDEVIMPSYTFVTSASAFVLRGAIPVFVDIRKDTCNIDESLIEQAITKKTKAIVVVHYAGVSCEMDKVSQIANDNGLLLIEDSAQALMSTYKDQSLGTFGAMSTVSFHETKNIICGEGGSLFINDEEYISRAEILREKGTNRSAFFRGEVDKYTWVDTGSSFLPGEVTAAFLFSQLESAKDITIKRKAIWDKYHESLESLERAEVIRRPFIPENTEHNAHMYYLIFRSQRERAKILNGLKDMGIKILRRI